MPVKLTVKHRSEDKSAGAENVLDDAEITLGRDKTCQVVLNEKAVSRNHAKITRDGALFFIEDLGSSYGTNINGKKLPKGEKRLLRNGDVIAIAQYDITFDRVADLPRDGEKTSFVARQVVKDVMKGLRANEQPFLRYMNGPNEGKRLEVGDAQEIIIGRDATMADLVFNDDLVSRRHVKIRRDWSGTHIEDLGSRNGIKVNKKKVTRKTLRDKDEVQVGNTRLLYLDPNEVRDEEQHLDEVIPDDEGGNTIPPPEPAPPPKPEPKPDLRKSAAAKPPTQTAPKPAPAAPAPPPPALEEPPAEEPAPEPEAEAPPEDEPMRETRALDTEDEPGEDLPAVDPKKKMIVIGVMGVTGLLAVILLVLVLAGA